SRRAHSLARATIETEREMLGDGLGQRDAALGQRLDQEDPAARRIHLRTELGKRRTVRQTETAVHALVHAFDAEPVQAKWTRHDGMIGRALHHRAQIPATKRPGVMTLWGSRLALRRCMLRPAGPASSPTGPGYFPALRA